MGAAYKATCYASESAARSAHCSGDYPQTGVTVSGELVTFSCEGTDAAGLLLLRSAAAASAPAPTPLATTTAYAACDETNLFTAAPSAAGMAEAFGYGSFAVVFFFLIAFAAKQPLSMIR